MLHDRVDLSDPAVMTHELDYLRQRLLRKVWVLDEHLLDGSIEDALIHYLACPEHFDPNRGVSLHFFLELWSRSYLYRRLRKKRRRRKHEKAVGVSPENFEKIMSENRPERSIYLGREREALDMLVAKLNPRDRAGVELLCYGASLEEWGRHLGIEQQPLQEQRSKVYNEKDRLRKKLKRMARNVQGGGRHSLRLGARSEMIYHPTGPARGCLCWRGGMVKELGHLKGVCLPN